MLSVAERSAGCCQETVHPHQSFPARPHVIERWKQEQYHYTTYAFRTPRCRTHYLHLCDMSAGYFPKREKVGLEDLFKGLVTACHILDHNGKFWCLECT